MNLVYAYIAGGFLFVTNGDDTFKYVGGGDRDDYPNGSLSQINLNGNEFGLGSTGWLFIFDTGEQKWLRLLENNFEAV